MSERSYTLPAIRVTAEERDAIRQAAESRGLSLSAWVRLAATDGPGATPARPATGVKAFYCRRSPCPNGGSSPTARCPVHGVLMDVPASELSLG